MQAAGLPEEAARHARRQVDLAEQRAPERLAQPVQHAARSTAHVARARALAQNGTGVCVQEACRHGAICAGLDGAAAASSFSLARRPARPLRPHVVHEEICHQVRHVHAEADGVDEADLVHAAGVVARQLAGDDGACQRREQRMRARAPASVSSLYCGRLPPTAAAAGAHQTSGRPRMRAACPACPECRSRQLRSAQAAWTACVQAAGAEHCGRCATRMAGVMNGRLPACGRPRSIMQQAVRRALCLHSAHPKRSEMPSISTAISGLPSAIRYLQRQQQTSMFSRSCAHWLQRDTACSLRMAVPS